MLVVDASVTIKWQLPEQDSIRALLLLTDAMRSNNPICAPTLLTYEVVNVLRQRVRRVGLSAQLADGALADLESLPITWLTPYGLHRESLAAAHKYNLLAAYDAHYLVLAQWLGCDLWTADQRLLRLLGGALPFVRALATYPHP